MNYLLFAGHIVPYQQKPLSLSLFLYLCLSACTPISLSFLLLYLSPISLGLLLHCLSSSTPPPPPPIFLICICVKLHVGHGFLQTYFRDLPSSETSNPERGIGTDMATLDSAYFLSQVSKSRHSSSSGLILTLTKGSRFFKTKFLRKLSLHLVLWAHDQWLGAEQDYLPCASTGTFSGNCQETETCIVWAHHTPQQPLENHPSGHLGEWAMLWLAEEMLVGQHERVDIPAHARTAHKWLPAHARTAHKGLLQKRPEELSAESPVISLWWSNRSRDWSGIQLSKV